MVKEEIKYCGSSFTELIERQLNVNEILFSNGFISQEQYEKVIENCSNMKAYRI